MMDTFKKVVRKFGSPGKNGRLKKQLLVLVPLIIFLFSLDIKPVHATIYGASFVTGFFQDIAFTVVGKIVFFISYIISFVVGIFIAVEAWLVGAILNINTNVVNSAPVKFGFPVSLSIVNLGFVLGIIVIAIATIIRYEQYGLKKILLKLVAAAILVNFSLVIAGTILNFSDQLTGYFLASVNPGDSVGGATNGLASANNFAKYLAGAFNPQRMFITDTNLTLNPLNPNSSNTGTNSSFAELTKKYAGALGGDIGAFLNLIFSIVFVVFSLILIAITLLALIVMLVIRYVFLGILLVIMPFAWLLWVFPAFHSSWTKWWTNFLRWTFFAPIVVFFLWLAIQTSAEISKGADGSYNFAQYASNSNPALATVSNLITNIFSPIVENFLQMAIVLGLMIGGLVAANSFGITFASTALGATKGLGKMTGKWAGSKSLEYGGAQARKKRMYNTGKVDEMNRPIMKEQSRAERLQERVGQIKNPALRYLASWPARGLTRVSTLSGEDQVERYAKMASGMKKADVIAAIPTLFGAKKAAFINDVGKRSNLDEMKNTDLSHGGKTKQLFKDLGMGEEYEKNVEKKSGFSSDAWEAMKAGASQQEINNIMAKDAQKWGKGDPANMQLNDLHSGVAGKFGLTDDALKKMAKANAYAFATAAPHLVSGALNQMKTQSLKNFAGDEEGSYGDYREGIDDAKRAGTITEKQRKERHEQFNRIIVNNIYYSGAGGTTPPPNPPGGAHP